MLIYREPESHERYLERREKPERPLSISIHLADIHSYNPLGHRVTFPMLFDTDLVFTSELCSHVVPNDFISVPNELSKKIEKYSEFLFMFFEETGTDLDIRQKLNQDTIISRFLDSKGRYILIKTTTSVTFLVDTVNTTFTIVDGSFIWHAYTESIEIRNKNTIIKCRLSDTERGLQLNGTYTSDGIHQESVYLDTSVRIEELHRYTNTKTNVRYVSYHHTYPNGNSLQVLNKNNLLVQCTYQPEKKSKIIISQCMMTVGGVRFRGSYREEKKDDIIVSKILKKDDVIVFEQDSTETKVDLLRKKTRPEMTIGWKLTKSSTGELRLVKLGIPSDAEIVIPVDYDFFTTRGKERCNKAIVMDIQLYTREEQSVVPIETTSYSYFYPGLSYVIGKEVKPDSFDNNQNESCGHGIHFFENRSDVFDWFDKLN